MVRVGQGSDRCVALSGYGRAGGLGNDLESEGRTGDLGMYVDYDVWERGARCGHCCGRG